MTACVARALADLALTTPVTPERIKQSSCTVVMEDVETKVERGTTFREHE